MLEALWCQGHPCSRHRAPRVQSLCRVQPVSTVTVMAPPHRHPSSPKPHDLIHLVTQSLPSFLPSFLVAALAVPPPNLLVALLILVHSSSFLPFFPATALHRHLSSPLSRPRTAATEPTCCFLPYSKPHPPDMPASSSLLGRASPSDLLALPCLALLSSSLITSPPLSRLAVRYANDEFCCCHTSMSTQNSPSRSLSPPQSLESLVSSIESSEIKQK